ncbi:MAG: MarR family transcriptional regulator [Candidatus Omnitrophota bacterium]|nr:MarR family transcriptional regulator [Candidatus Omnitrophota bacterium]
MKVSLYEFADRINDIVPIMIREFAKYQVNELSKGKITLPQFLILGFLEKSGEAKMSGLASFMAVSTAAMTGTVDRLVRYGYVTREPEPKDRRVIKIKITLKGRELVKKINSQRRQMIVDIFGKISEADRSDYLRVLTKIEEILSRQS